MGGAIPPNYTMNDADNRELYQAFLDVRDAAAPILENTSLADIVNDQKPPHPKSHKRHSAKKHDLKGV